MRDITSTKCLYSDDDTSCIGETFLCKIDFPDTCPHCNYAIEPTLQSCFYTTKNKTTIIYTLFFCPKCKSCFTALYKSTSVCKNAYFKTKNTITYPSPLNKTNFSNNIAKISPQFVNIYKQSEITEQSDLTDVTGIGYRKALEFLIKDFSIFLHPEKKYIIEKASLSVCIKEYINDPKISTLATACAWLGNDETHYVRKHEDYNINNLKTFMKSLVAYIDAYIAYLDAKKLLTL